MQHATALSHTPQPHGTLTGRRPRGRIQDLQLPLDRVVEPVMYHKNENVDEQRVKEIESMTSICSYDKCPLLAERNDSFCILHQKKEGKSRESIIAALEKYEEYGQKQNSRIGWRKKRL